MCKLVSTQIFGLTYIEPWLFEVIILTIELNRVRHKWKWPERASPTITLHQQARSRSCYPGNGWVAAV
jgi:hypothetical protein